MTQKKHTRAALLNSGAELVGLLAASSVTGGSSLSGYGTTAFSNNYSLITLNRIVLTYLYSGNGLFQTAVQLPIQDALARRIVIESAQMSPEDVDQILDWLEDHDSWQHLEDAKSWERVYGGGGLAINTDQDPEKPLNLRRMKGAPIEFYDFDRWQVSAKSSNFDEFLGYDDMTKADLLYYQGQPIHTSRIIFMTGKRAPSYIRRQLRGWGMSEGERMLRDLNNYLKTQDVLYEILDESKIDIYKIKGLANKLLTAGGTNAIAARIKAANEVKSYINALVLDAEEEYEQKTLTFAGLADVMRENRIGIASALRIPMTKLFGTSASGLNATGEGDADNYNEMVQSEIQAKMRPQIKQMIELACANLWGYVPEFRFKFPPLKALPALEAEQIKASEINRICMLYDRGLITDGQAIGDELAKGETISADLAAKFQARPLPPGGAQSVDPVKENKGIEVFKAARDAVKNALNGRKDAPR